MTVNEFKSFLMTKTVGHVDLPQETLYVARVYAGLMKIAKDTTPLRLVVSNPDGYEILRRIAEFSYVRFPAQPIIDSGLSLDIESELLDALAYYVMAGLERQRSKVLMGMYHTEIDSYNDKLTETFLEEATNDAERFYVFP